MHRLLAEQLERLYGAIDRAPIELRPLVDLVDRTYAQNDDERNALTHSLGFTNRELQARCEELQARADVLDATTLIVGLLLDEARVGDVADQLARQLSDRLGLPYAGIYLREQGGPRLSRVGATAPAGEEGFPASLPESGSALADVDRLSRSLIEPRANEALRAELPFARALVAVPIATPHATLGLIALGDREPRDDLSTMLGRLCSVALQLGQAVERRRADDELRLTQFAVEGASEAVLWAGPDGRIRYANDAACRLLGFGRDELCRRSLQEVDATVATTAWPVFWSELVAARTRSRESVFIARDGSEVAVEVVLSHLRLDSGEMVCAVARDIRERHRVAEERRRLEGQVQQAEKLRSLGVMAGGIAHDFNNLLQVIVGNTRLALTDLESPNAVSSSLVQIEKAASRATELTKKMLMYSGRRMTRPHRLDLTGLIAQMSPLLRKVVAPPATLELELDHALPEVQGDASQLHEVVMNLVTNSAEALDGKAGRVVIRTGQLEADTAYLAATYLSPELPAGAYVFIEVEDSGCGMDADTAERICDPFFTTKFKGRGLGLASVLGVVRAHQGALRVDTALGRGTTIRVLMPLESRRAPAPKAPPTSDSGPPAWRVSGTALVIDDEQGVLTMAQRTLARVGLDVLLAVDGAEGVAKFRENMDRISIVILDMAMPKMPGEVVLAEIRKLRKDVPVIVASGYSEEEALEKIQDDAHVTAILPKPYFPQTLLQKLRIALGA